MRNSKQQDYVIQLRIMIVQCQLSRLYICSFPSGQRHLQTAFLCLLVNFSLLDLFFGGAVRIWMYLKKDMLEIA